jgi:hypothetical protein
MGSWIEKGMEEREEKKQVGELTERGVTKGVVEGGVYFIFGFIFTIFWFGLLVCRKKLSLK